MARRWDDRNKMWNEIMNGADGWKNEWMNWENGSKQKKLIDFIQCAQQDRFGSFKNKYEKYLKAQWPHNNDRLIKACYSKADIKMLYKSIHCTGVLGLLIVKFWDSGRLEKRLLICEWLTKLI